MEAANGEPFGAAFYNPHSLIALRLLGASAAAPVDADFLAGLLARALALRETLYDAPFYRLVHAEAEHQVPPPDRTEQRGSRGRPAEADRQWAKGTPA